MGKVQERSIAVAIAALSLLAEFLGSKYSMNMLVWAAAIFFWIAIVLYAQRWRFRGKGFLLGLLLILMLTGTHYWAKDGLAKAQESPGKPANQSATSQGSNNTTGNSNQNGNGNTTVIGNQNVTGNNNRVQYSSSGTVGKLVPAKQADPIETGCIKTLLDGPGFFVLLGPNLYGTNNPTWPHKVLTASGRTLLALNKTKDGKLTVTTDVFDSNDDIVVSIEDNRYRVSNDAFDVVSSPSSLSVVIKHQKEKVLDIQFLSKHLVKILGRYRGPDGFDLLANEASVTVYAGHSKKPVAVLSGGNCSFSDQGIDMIF